MPLSQFFADQFRQIRAFMLDPVEVVRVVRVDPDLEPILLRALVRIEDEPDNPHAMLFANAPFEDAEQWFTALTDELVTEQRKNAAALDTTVAPPDDPTQHPAQRFCSYASALADGLPDQLGSLVLIVQPAEVADAPAFAHCIEYLAGNVRSRWLKLIVPDPRLEPRLEGIETRAEERVGVQVFYLSPEAIEGRLRAGLNGGGAGGADSAADPRQQRRTRGVLAGFAFARRDYHEAAKLQFEWAKSAEEAEEPAEAASAWYNLGNTMLETGALEHAERFYVQCCELCLEHEVQGVLPMALTNLGITLSRQGRVEEAIGTLLVAYRNFKAQRHRPGQAFVFDALAGVYWAAGRHDDAERAWLAAYDIYAGITSDAFADLRESGCRDIRDKLERFCTATHRPNRLDAMDRVAGVR